jgi:hypothetical protein
MLTCSARYQKIHYLRQMMCQVGFYPKLLLARSNMLSSKIHNNFLIFEGSHWGASTVKYTTPLLSIGLSENDLEPYTHFEFFVEKNQKHLKNTLIYKAKHFIFINIFFKKNLHILKDGASNVQVGTLNM